MASNPPGKCCTIGVKHEGETVGEYGTIGNIKTYFSYPKDRNTENAVIFLTDVIGIDTPNPKLIADQLAANGYFVVMPDLFNGNAVPLNRPEDFDLWTWLKDYTPEHVDPIVDATIKEMRGPLGCKHIGSVAYCFGGKYLVRFLKKGHIDAGFTAHPSFVDADELKAIEGPLSIAAAEIDEIFTVEKRHESEDILSRMKNTYQITLYSGVEHGFATRADLSIKHNKWAKEQAFYQAVQWLDEHIKA